jgi:hypothetical protein
MRIRAYLGAGLVLVLLRCATDDQGGGGGDGTSGNAGEGGENSSGTAGTQGGSSGSGTSGQAGETQGGTSGKGGSSGGAGEGGSGGSAGEGAAGAGGSGGEDDGGQTVSGRVTMPFGTPISGAVISIGTTTVGTDADGYFEIEDVAPTYDLVLINETTHFARVLRGLTARNVTLLGGGMDVERSALIRGVVTGGVGLPIPTDHWTSVTYEGPNRAYASFPAFVRRDDASYSFSAYWYDEPSTAGSLFGIQAQLDSSDHILNYVGFGTKPFTLSDGGTFGEVNGSTPATTVSFRPVAEHTVTGMVTAPAGYSTLLWFSVGPFFVDDFSLTSNGPYSVVLPTDVPEAPSYVQVHSERDNGTAGVEVSETTHLLDNSDTSVDLSTPAAPTSLLPVNAAVGVNYDTNFTWNQPPNSVSSFAVVAGDWFVVTTSTSSSARIPDLETYGIGLPAGGDGAWQVNVVFGADTVDGWVEFDMNNLAYVYEHGHGGWATGLARTFTYEE